MARTVQQAERDAMRAHAILAADMEAIKGWLWGAMYPIRFLKDARRFRLFDDIRVNSLSMLLLLLGAGLLLRDFSARRERDAHGNQSFQHRRR